MGGIIDPNHGCPAGMDHKDMEISRLRAELDKLRSEANNCKECQRRREERKNKRRAAAEAEIKEMMAWARAVREQEGRGR